MKKKPPAKKNPADATLRNVRAGLTRDRSLRDLYVALEKRVAALEQKGKR